MQSPGSEKFSVVLDGQFDEEDLVAGAKWVLFRMKDIADKNFRGDIGMQFGDKLIENGCSHGMIVGRKYEGNVWGARHVDTKELEERFEDVHYR